MFSMKSETAVSRLWHTMSAKQQGTNYADKPTGTAEEPQSTSVKLQNVSVDQLENLSHMSMPLKELAIF